MKQLIITIFFISTVVCQAQIRIPNKHRLPQKLPPNHLTATKIFKDLQAGKGCTYYGELTLSGYSKPDGVHAVKQFQYLTNRQVNIRVQGSKLINQITLKATDNSTKRATLTLTRNHRDPHKFLNNPRLNFTPPNGERFDNGTIIRVQKTVYQPLGILISGTIETTKNTVGFTYTIIPNCTKLI